NRQFVGCAAARSRAQCFKERFMNRFEFCAASRALVFSWLVISGTGHALNEYYSISRSPRALGMGGAFYGLSDDQHALFYNPAGLTAYRGGNRIMAQFKGDVSGSLTSLLSSLPEQTDSVDQWIDELDSF